MSERWWRVMRYRDTPEPVEAVKVTEKTLTLKGTNGWRDIRVDKVSQSERYFKAWADAREHILQRAHDELNRAEERVQQALNAQVKAGMLPVEEPA